jgi:hypothetical protein
MLESCRPDFAVAVYPGHLWINEDREIPRHAPTKDDENFGLRPNMAKNDWDDFGLAHQVSDWGSGAAGYFGWMREGPSRTGV